MIFFYFLSFLLNYIATCTVFRENDLNLLKTRLPTVYIVPIPSRFNFDCCSNTTGMDNLDQIFHKWLLTSYCRIVDDPLKADIYFVPAYPSVCIQRRKIGWYDKVHHFFSGTADYKPFWIDLDQTLAQFQNVSNEKSFILAPHPHHVPSGVNIDKKLRQVLDVRYGRLDSSLTPNGKDIFVPYKVSRNASEIIFSFESIADQRKFSVYSPCKPAGGGNDDVRNWRTKVYNYLNTYPEMLAVNTFDKDFDSHLVSSDFCFILPGDTASTSKLYKAMFAGCIPVIFYTYMEDLPFFDIVDWKKLAVLVSKHVINIPTEFHKFLNEIQILRKSGTALKAFRSAILNASFVFDWSTTSWPSPYHFTLLEFIRNDIWSRELLYQ